MSAHHQVVVVGGGTAGISVAARLLDRADPPSVAIIDPAQQHYYQPLWTLVGAGVVPREVSERSTASLIPRGATWIRERVDSFSPSDNSVTTADGTTITYDQLVVAPGIQIDWDKVDGLRDALGRGGVCSNYAYDQVAYTWEVISNFTGGNALFTFPRGPVKCAGAAQKITYLAEHAFRRSGVRTETDVIFASAAAGIFGIPRYREALDKVVAEKDIDARYRHSLVAIDGRAKVATFELSDGTRTTIDYEMIHVTPPQSAPDFVKSSPLANAEGWVDVDRHTMQHNTFPNVFSLGDASSLPCSKTGAAIRKQAPVLVDNLLAAREGRELEGSYDGYASCPIVTGYGKVLLAEFGYDGVVMESFPFDQAQPRYSMWALKLHALPALYWNGMLRGRA